MELQPATFNLNKQRQAAFSPPNFSLLSRRRREGVDTVLTNLVKQPNLTMKSVIALSLIASAAAFAPAKQAASTTALNSFENELGAQAPLGFFDPLGLVADGDQEKFDRLRYVEIKHGRVSSWIPGGFG